MRSILQFFFFFAASMSSLSQSAKVPGPPFTITITTAQAAQIGSPIMIRIVLRSISEKQINVPERRHDGTQGEYNYRITVKNLGDGTAPPDTEHGSKLKNHSEVSTMTSTVIRHLNYGDEVTEDADLNNIVKITKPGDYEVQVERDDPLYSSLLVKSNTLTVHVTS